MGPGRHIGRMGLWASVPVSTTHMPPTEHCPPPEPFTPLRAPQHRRASKNKRASAEECWGRSPCPALLTCRPSSVSEAALGPAPLICSHPFGQSLQLSPWWVGGAVSQIPTPALWSPRRYFPSCNLHTSRTGVTALQPVSTRWDGMLRG